LLGLNVRRVAPPVGQFTYYETTVSFPNWIVLLGLVTLSGVLKAMRYVYPIPGELLWWTSALHVTSMVLLAVKALDHLRYVLAPSRWSLMTAMAGGWMSERVVQRRHPAWYEQIHGGEPETIDPAPAQAVSAAPAGGAPVIGATGGGS
jgi:cytochrome b subunit of formate dehydrogenase